MSRKKKFKRSTKGSGSKGVLPEPSAELSSNVGSSVAAPKKHPNPKKGHTVVITPTDDNRLRVDYIDKKGRVLKGKSIWSLNTRGEIIEESYPERVYEKKTKNFKDFDINIKNEQPKVFLSNETETLNINIPNFLEKKLQTLVKDKNLQLISSIEEYENQYTKLNWECQKCGHSFSASKKAVKKNKHPCPNCREHKGGVQREKIIDYNTGVYSQEVILSEILREAFRLQLDKEDISNSELGRLLKYELKQALNNKTEFLRWIIYRFIKSVNNILTNDNRKTALKALKEYGYNKNYFLSNNDLNKPESDLAFLIWYSFSNELDDDALTGNKLSEELNSDINAILRNKNKISISIYLKYKSICKEKLKDKNKKLALSALRAFGKIRNYKVDLDAPNYFELRLSKKLWNCFSNQNNRYLTLKEVSSILHHKHILYGNIKENKKFDDPTLDDFERAVEEELTGNNFNKSIQALDEYRQKRPPIHIYTEEQRQKTSMSMKKKWGDEDYQEKMQSRECISGKDHYKWNFNRDVIIKDILDFNNPQVKTITQIAKKYGRSITHIRKISKNEVEKNYTDFFHEERFPGDLFALIGGKLHGIIKLIMTAHFLDLGLKIYSEIIIDLINRFTIDQLLFNIKNQKYLSKRLKYDEVMRKKLNINRLDTIIAFLFDFTSDISDDNIKNKARKYQKDDMFLIIIGTRWPKKDTRDIKPTSFKNVRIVKHDLFSRLIGLKEKHLFDYKHAIELSYAADLDGLKNFYNKIKEEFISKYRAELSKGRYKTGFYNDDLKKDMESIDIDYSSFFSKDSKYI